MNEVTEENKRLVLEGIDILFNKRGYKCSRKVLVAQVHPAQTDIKPGVECC